MRTITDWSNVEHERVDADDELPAFTRCGQRLDGSITVHQVPPFPCQQCIRAGTATRAVDVAGAGTDDREDDDG